MANQVVTLTWQYSTFESSMMLQVVRWQICESISSLLFLFAPLFCVLARAA